MNHQLHICVIFFKLLLLQLSSSEDNCPWAAIASLALHKLYTDWQSQGYTLPKVQHISLAPIKTRETFLRNLRICQWTLLAAEEEEGAQVFLMLTKMLSRCIFLFLFSPVYPHTLQNILHQFFHCCDCNIHSQRVNEMAGKMKITLDFELTGEVRIETVKPQFDLNLINRRSGHPMIRCSPCLSLWLD